MTTQKTIKERLLALDTAAVSDALDSLYISGGGCWGLSRRSAERKSRGRLLPFNMKLVHRKKIAS